MIVGLLPVGGQGKRLGQMPFSKEMLPAKGFDHYKPVISIIVDKMRDAGAERIFLVHGESLKRDVHDYFYGDENVIHVRQSELGFSKVLLDFANASLLHVDMRDTQVLFALPDSTFCDNPFLDLVDYDGICCALFKTIDGTKVDRIKPNGEFDVKSSKNSGNSCYFWGCIKFDFLSIMDICENIDLDIYSEIGDILNMYDFSTVECGDYLDLGTWGNLNYYWENWECY